MNIKIIKDYELPKDTFVMVGRNRIASCNKEGKIRIFEFYVDSAYFKVSNKTEKRVRIREIKNEYY